MHNDSPKSELHHGLTPATVKQIRAVFAKHPRLKQAILYGSRAKGTYRNGSDIDLTLIGEALSYQELGQIDNELDDLFLPYTFDLSLSAHITNRDLIDHIERVGQVLYQKDDREEIGI